MYTVVKNLIFGNLMSPVSITLSTVNSSSQFILLHASFYPKSGIVIKTFIPQHLIFKIFHFFITFYLASFHIPYCIFSQAVQRSVVINIFNDSMGKTFALKHKRHFLIKTNKNSALQKIKIFSKFE